MKAKALDRSQRSIMTALFVVGGLVGLYFYRRGGGKLLPLVAAGVSQFGKVREYLRSGEVADSDRIDRSGKTYSSSEVTGDFSGNRNI